MLRKLTAVSHKRYNTERNSFKSVYTKSLQHVESMLRTQLIYPCYQ